MRSVVSGRVIVCILFLLFAFANGCKNDTAPVSPLLNGNSFAYCISPTMSVDSNLACTTQVAAVSGGCLPYPYPQGSAMMLTCLEGDQVSDRQNCCDCAFQNCIAPCSPQTNVPDLWGCLDNCTSEYARTCIYSADLNVK